MAITILRPLAGQLAEGLEAQIYECGPDGTFIGNVIVQAPLVNAADLELTLNWVSPFESVGAESKAPALTALLQSGQAQSVITAVSSLVPPEILSGFGDFGAAVSSLVGSSRDELLASAKTLQGRSGITKLNSRQIFSGMPPVKLPISLRLRAWRDAAEEVEAPLDQLMQWALAKEIADVSVLEGVLRDKSIKLEGLFPSIIPSFVGIRYGGRSYGPLVIDSITQPLLAPRDSTLNRIAVTTTITLSTLTAIDRRDWDRFRSDFARGQIDIMRAA